MTQHHHRVLTVLASALVLAAGGCRSTDNSRSGSTPGEAQSNGSTPATVDRNNVGREPAVSMSGDGTGQSSPNVSSNGTSGSARNAASPGMTNVERAEVLQQAGQLQDALTEFERAIEINPKLTVAFLGAGDIYRQQGDFAGAERRYAQAAALEPGSFRAQYSHALSLQLLGRIPEAVRAYLRALEIQPEDFNANMNVGIAYIQLEEPGESLPYLQKAVRIDPQSAAARTNLGAAYSALNRHEEAVVEYQQAAELTELTGPVLLNLANSLGRVGRYEEMVNTLEQLTKTEPTPNAFERLGSGLFRLRRYDEALAAFRKAIEIDPNHYPALNGVGVCLMNQWEWSGRKDEQARQEALLSWRRSLQVERSQPKILELIGRYK